MAESKNLWGGRFTGKADEKFVEFNRSFGFDRRLLEADITASQAHCEALRAAGILVEAEAAQIRGGLRTIASRVEADARYLDSLHAEDVHSFVEARLAQLIGETALK